MPGVSRSTGPGFTLIELLVVMAIVALLVGLSMPGFSQMIQNGRISSAAKSVALGLQTARTEAIRRNQQVDFVMTNTVVGGLNDATAAPSANGGNWVVRIPVAASAPTVLEAKGTGANDSTGVGISAIAVGGGPAFTGTVSFNSLGTVVNAQQIQINVDNQTAGACAASGGPMRCQRIRVRPGGQVQTCDPNAPTGDSRFCPSP